MPNFRIVGIWTGNRSVQNRRQEIGRWSIEGGADSRSRFVEGSGAPFLFPAVSRERDRTRASLFAGSRAIWLMVRATGPWLEMSVTDDGQGVASSEVEQLFFAERPRVHALVLLRRRLQGLFGSSFRLVVRSEIGEGTTVTICIPLRTTNVTTRRVKLEPLAADLERDRGSPLML
jgi:hypothetical protein